MLQVLRTALRTREKRRWVVSDRERHTYGAMFEKTWPTLLDVWTMSSYCTVAAIALLPLRNSSFCAVAAAEFAVVALPPLWSVLLGSRAASRAAMTWMKIKRKHLLHQWFAMLPTETKRFFFFSPLFHPFIHIFIYYKFTYLPKKIKK